MRRKRCSALLLAAVTLSIGGCGDGSGTHLTHFTLSLQSDAPCYGVRAQIDLAALNKSTGSCAANPAVVTAGCVANIYAEAETLVADVRGCMIDAGTDLFDCDLAADDAASIEASTTVTYGCGCQDSCPTTVSIDVGIAGRTSDDGGVSLAMHTANDHPVASETTASLLTTSTFCGTCCDYFVSSRVDMSAASRVTEVAFVLSLDGGGDQCSFSADDCQFAIATRGPSYIRSVDRTLEVCVSDPEGISPDATLLTCDLIAPSYGNPPLTLARALGEQFENLDPAPTLTLEDAFSF